MIIAVLAEKMSEFLIKQYNATGDYRFEDAATLIDNQSTQITRLQLENESLKQVARFETDVTEQAIVDFSGMKSEVEALRKYAEWQPIETAPKDKYILVTDFGEYPDAPDIYVAERFDFGKYWSTSHGRVHGVSHWMPLPKLPTAIAKDTQEQ